MHEGPVRTYHFAPDDLLPEKSSMVCICEKTLATSHKFSPIATEILQYLAGYLNLFGLESELHASSYTRTEILEPT